MQQKTYELKKSEAIALRLAYAVREAADRSAAEIHEAICLRLGISTESRLRPGEDWELVQAFLPDPPPGTEPPYPRKAKKEEAEA